MSYVVLARKWRPQRFSDLTGQEHIARTLTHAIERDRVPHAMLFAGARGVGKTSSARIVAMALNCVEGPTPSPCGQCDACREIQQSRSVDVLEIDGASNRSISDVRELRESVRYAPQRDRYKIIIIDEVHMLTNEAFNALLKTLEEPPPHVVFLFATTEAQKIPITILSRCQRFDFRRITFQDTVERLRFIAEQEQLDIEDDVFGLIARQASGGMRDALSLLDQLISFSEGRLEAAAAQQLLGAADRTHFFRLSEAVLRRDAEGALRTLEALAGWGADMNWVCREWLVHLRDLTVVASVKDARGLTALTERELAEAHRQATSVPQPHLHQIFDRMAEAADKVLRSTQPRWQLEMALLQLCALEAVAPIDDLVAQLRAIADGRRLPPPTPQDGGTNQGATGVSREPAASPGPLSTSATPAAAPMRAVNPPSPARPQVDGEPEVASSSTDGPPPPVEARSSETAGPTEPGPGNEGDEPVSPSAPGEEPVQVVAPSSDTAAALETSNAFASQEAAAQDPVPVSPADTEAQGSAHLSQEARPSDLTEGPATPSPAAPAEEPAPSIGVEAAPHAHDGTFDFEHWRALVRRFGASEVDLPAHGRLRQLIVELPEKSDAPIVLAHREQWTAEECKDALSIFTEWCALQGIALPTFHLKVHETELDADGVLRLSDVEAREERMRQEACIARLREHPATRLVLSTWPNATLQQIQPQLQQPSDEAT